MDPKSLTDLAVQILEDKKAFNLVVLDIQKISSLADYFIIASGRSSIHVQALAEAVEDELKKQIDLQPRKEGLREGRWVLLDYGDLIVHIFQEEEREFYHLERLWRDALQVENLAEKVEES